MRKSGANRSDVAQIQRMFAEGGTDEGIAEVLMLPVETVASFRGYWGEDGLVKTAPAVDPEPLVPADSKEIPAEEAAPVPAKTVSNKKTAKKKPDFMS